MTQENKKGARDATAYAQRGYDHRPVSQLVSVLDRPYESVWTLPQVAHMCCGKYATYWKGTPLLKDPFAMQMYTQMIQHIQPQTIFDLGTCLGGSALFFADLLQLLGPPGAVVLSVDIQDIRPPDIVAAMTAHPCIHFIEGDATDFSALVEVLNQKKESSHPWIVVEDCHVDSYAVASQVRLYGKPGDYLVFEDTHEHEPNISGMSAADMKNYTTGFGREKYCGLLEAMALLTPEFLIDTEYTDAFGYNGTMQVNGVFRLCEPPETAIATATYTNASMEISADAITQQLRQHGHMLFRAAHDMEKLPFEEIQAALGLVNVDDYRLGTQIRYKAGGDTTGTFAGATTFDGSQAIYPHHELSYAPNPPARILFMCAQVPRVGGETTIFDGVQAWKELPLDLRQKIQSSEVVYRRNMYPAQSIQATGNYLGVSWQDAFKVGEFAQAVAAAKATGYTVIEANDQNQVLTLEYTQFLFHETTGGTALFSSVQGNNAWAYKRMQGTPAINSTYWKRTGQEVSDLESRELAIAYAKARKCFQWKNCGDFVVLDNFWFAHGRSPFLGSRLVFVTMGCAADDMKEMSEVLLCHNSGGTT